MTDVEPPLNSEYLWLDAANQYTLQTCMWENNLFESSEKFGDHRNCLSPFHSREKKKQERNTASHYYWHILFPAAIIII